MKYTLLLITLFTGINGYTQGIKFESLSSWAQVKEQALAQKKKILVDVNTTWCIPCRQIDSVTFSNPSIGEYVNEGYLSIKVQMDQTKKDNEHTRSWYADAKQIGSQYGVTGYPTVLVFDDSTRLLGRIVGYRDPIGFKKDLKNIENFKPKYQLYENGKRDSSFIKALVSEAKTVGQVKIAHQIAQDFIRSLSNNDVFKYENLLFIFLNTPHSTDPGFKLFRENSTQVDQILKFKATKSLTEKIMYTEEIEPYIAFSDVDWERVHSKIIKQYGGVYQEFYSGIRMIHALDHQKWDEFGKYYAEYFRTAYKHSKYHINNISWPVFEHIEDPRILDVAITAMKYNVENLDKDDPSTLDTYANLLYKAGRKKEAISVQERAVKLGPNEASLKTTLQKMKMGEQTWK